MSVQTIDVIIMIVSHSEGFTCTSEGWNLEVKPVLVIKERPIYMRGKLAIKRKLKNWDTIC